MSKRQPKPKPQQPHPSIAEFDEQVHALEEQKGALEGVISFLTEKRWAVVLPLIKEKYAEILAQQRSEDNTVLETDYDALEEGYHECPTSPSVRCIYDTTNDPSRDSCIFCGDPEERK